MNLASRDYQEKRNFIRMKVETPVQVTTAAGLQLEGMCHNLSGGGMLLSVPETLPLGTEIEVLVTSNHGHNPMLKARTTVSRVLAQPDTLAKPCLVGLSIVELLE